MDTPLTVDEAFDTVRKFFEVNLGQGQIESVLSLSPVPVEYDNVIVRSGDLQDSKDNKTIWGRVSMREGAGGAASVGVESIRRYAGITIFSLFCERGEGTFNCRQYAAKITKHIIDKSTGSTKVKDLLVRTPYTTIIGTTEDWFQVNVTIPYQFDYHHKST